MTDHRIWILGAPDPEMERIEALLRECGEHVEHAVDDHGERVHPGTACRAQCAHPDIERIRAQGGACYLIECDLADPRYGTHSPEHTDCAGIVTRIDHHRPGDPGYGREPSEFLSASSLGQVIAELARLGALPASWPPELVWYGHLNGDTSTHDPPALDPGCIMYAAWAATDGVDGVDGGDYEGWVVSDAEAWLDIPPDLFLAAAADHCLGAAYRGECPGVDPDELMQWRAEQRAAFQGRSVDEVMADIERAQEMVRNAPYTAAVDQLKGQWLNTPRVGAWANRAIFRDMRSELQQDARGGGVPELPEAALRIGEPYVAGPLITPDGRRKIVCSGTPDVVRAFLDHWAPSQGLVDTYGDPARGFAGGYLTEEA